MAKIMGYPIFLPFRCHGQSLPCRRGIVFGQQIHAVLVHADALPLGVFGQGLVQTFRDSQLELAGVAFQIIRLPDGDTVLQGGFKPGPLGILGVATADSTVSPQVIHPGRSG